MSCPAIAALSADLDVLAVTRVDRVIHRFFDTSPFSPSGRWLAVTRLPAEDRLPSPGEVAEVWLVDLETGTERCVAQTRGWDTQLGAQAQWGATDDDLYFNDLSAEDWRPYGVRLNPRTGHRLRLGTPVYAVSPDGGQVVAPNLTNIGLTQAGYGVVVPPAAVQRNRGAASDDGIWLSDTDGQPGRLITSIATLVEQVHGTELERWADGDFYGFHVKWSPAGDRLMYVLRWLPRAAGQPARREVITLDADGRNPRVALSAERWAAGGHHPNWAPDGRSIIMNLRLRADEPLRFVRFAAEGGAVETLAPERVGSGHPTLSADGTHLLTDAYPHEPVAAGDGTVPIRWIELASGREEEWLRLWANPIFSGPKRELRVDPHPAWSRDFRLVAVNAWDGATRRVLVLRPPPLH
jgi:hypothetical protein